MLINGEKYACEACVRGHRVSNCQHHDRPLQHINKKGRPVSQCQHCRSMRKSRSAHTKCDCGEKMFKCAHLKTTHEGHTDSCCCNHGGRCTCCHKKEHPQLETVPEADGLAPVKCAKGGIRNRRRATVHAESMLSFDEHGNRKTSTRHTKAAQKDEPYKLNRQNSAYSLHSISPTDSPGCNSPSSISFPEHRMSRSEAASPLMTGSSSFPELNGQLPALDLSSIGYRWNENKFDLYSGASDSFEQPVFSAGLSSTSVDWSHYDGLEFAKSAAKPAAAFAPSNYSQPQSYSAFGEMSSSEQLPTLTTNTSTSGEPSEIDDLISTSFEDLDQTGGFGTGIMGTGFDVAAIPAGFSNTDLSTLDYDEFKMRRAGTQFLPTPASVVGDEPALVSATASMGNFSQSLPDEDLGTWIASGDYGLPSHEFQLPLTDSPDGLPMATFWAQ